MKKTLLSALALLLAGTGPLGAQPAPGGNARHQGGSTVGVERKFQILVKINDNEQDVQATNAGLRGLQQQAAAQAGNRRGVFLDLLKTGFGSSLTQKTVNATSNVLSLGLNYLAGALKGHQEDWLRTARQECTFTKKLSSETTIEDFYAAPSAKGAMDPENMKFQGFGCRHYLECKQEPGRGREVFLLFCKLRKDEEGLKRIVNHSKFAVELDTLVFDPYFCGLPNDSSGSANCRFDFERRKNLTLTVKVRIFSSWMNEAILPAIDQQLGEFSITARIDPSKLKAVTDSETGRTDSLFIYDPADPDFDRLVSVSGDCFIVPRSFTGTSDGATYAPSWGTGQYRLEMDVTESCQVNEDYYLVREAGNGEQVANAALPGKRKWDKAKWKVEWKAMKARRKGTPFLKSVWNSIVTAYRGSGWVETFTDPLSTALYTYETAKLNEWLDLAPSTPSAGAAAQKAAAGAAQAAQSGAKGGAKPAQQPQGGSAQGAKP